MSEMQPHQQRVIGEKAELDERLQKLTAFLASPAGREVDDDERYLLLRQASFMGNYSDTLGRRIALWEAKSRG